MSPWIPIGLALASWCGSAAAAGFAPGETVPLAMPEVDRDLLVFVPEDYGAARRHPVIFHYHGTSGRPTVEIPKLYTGGRGFVVVGMAYVTQGQTRPERDYLLSEFDFLKAVRTAVGERLAIDPSRCYVGGFSKGGWFGSEYAEAMMEEFAGAYMIGAGWNPSKRPPRRIAGGKPVYIGTGLFDPNYARSVAAIAKFRDLGAEVTFDEYPALGHAIPSARGALAEAFRQWWRVEATRPDREPLRAEVADWAEAAAARLAALDPPLDRWLFADQLRRMPFYPFLSADQRAVLDGGREVAAGDASLAAEMAARRAYLPAMSDAAEALTMEAKLAALRRCHRVWEAHPETLFGRRAGVEAERLRGEVFDLDRWRWPSAEARGAVEAQLAREPVPRVPEAADLRGPLAELAALFGQR